MPQMTPGRGDTPFFDPITVYNKPTVRSAQMTRQRDVFPRVDTDEIVDAR